jgi:hypothetical protein
MYTVMEQVRNAEYMSQEITPGTDVMILKIFSPNFSAKKLAFLTQSKA